MLYNSNTIIIVFHFALGNLAPGEIWVREVTSTEVDLLVGSTNNNNAEYYNLVLEVS